MSAIHIIYLLAAAVIAGHGADLQAAARLLDLAKVGGRHGIRTHDPHVANVVLSQLS